MPEKYTFKTNDSTFKTLNGETVTIIRTITEPEEGFDAEVLPMHRVRVESTGQEFEVWPDELTPTEV
ncbi:hypothetical protein PBI_MIMI_298 [Arthrobacter phage Mimi]|nr:hypothetical protein PBI_MIMI_92 [Arthrobacter phage Mimi]